MPTTTLNSATLLRTLVLACGNPMRGDDGVGWQIGCAMQQQLPIKGLAVLVTQQLLPEHAEAVSNADIVVFVDCSANLSAGVVARSVIHPRQSLPHIFTHHLDPASLLKLALDLYARVPTQAVAVTVGGESFELTSRLSEQVEAALPHAMEMVYSEL